LLNRRSIYGGVSEIMNLAWIIYLLWAAILCGSIWGVLKTQGINKLMLHIPIIGLSCFVIFSYVFILNHGSNVAQVSSNHDLWRLWFNFWIPLSVLTLITLISSIIFSIVAFVKHKVSAQFMLGLLLFFQSSMCAYHIILNMPDA